MTRDDSTGGWVPVGGGGLSTVSVRNNLICGKRIVDSTMVLSCIIQKDLQYNRVMPTFHHWVTGDEKYGLTFQTAADARAFDKGVRTALEQLREGVRSSVDSGTVGEEAIFMALHLPADSRSASGSSSTESGCKPGDAVSVTSSSPRFHRKRLVLKSSHTLPLLSGDTWTIKAEPDTSERRVSPSKTTVAPLPGRCLDTYSEVGRRDRTLSCIECVTCFACAQCIFYHCASEDIHHWSCEPADDPCRRRWTAVTLLALLLPCLWCYPPLRACHRCGYCGGVHEPE